MAEESSYREVRRIREEFARERAWAGTPEAQSLRTLASQAFEFAHAVESLSNRSLEAWIASGTSGVTAELVARLASEVEQMSSLLGADLN